jgi:hypothetical protein
MTSSTRRDLGLHRAHLIQVLADMGNPETKFCLMVW